MRDPLVGKLSNSVDAKRKSVYKSRQQLTASGSGLGLLIKNDDAVSQESLREKQFVQITHTRLPSPPNLLGLQCGYTNSLCDLE